MGDYCIKHNIVERNNTAELRFMYVSHGGCKEVKSIEFHKPVFGDIIYPWETTFWGIHCRDMQCLTTLLWILIALNRQYRKQVCNFWLVCKWYQDRIYALDRTYAVSSILYLKKTLTVCKYLEVNTLFVKDVSSHRFLTCWSSTIHVKCWLQEDGSTLMTELQCCLSQR